MWSVRLIHCELERHTAVRSKLYRKSVLEKNKELFVQNWMTLSPLSVGWTGEGQHPPEQDFEAPMFPTCALKSLDTTTLSKLLLLRTKWGVRYKTCPFACQRRRLWELMPRLNRTQLPFRTLADCWILSLHRRLLTGLLSEMAISPLPLVSIPTLYWSAETNLSSDAWR